MEPTNALTLLISIYVGAISGGLITATLMRMPGTPAAVMTTLDGYPLAQSGQPGRALGLSITASFIGGLVSFVFLVLLSRPLSEFASRFGPFELFSLVMMALVLMASVSQGSMLKGLLSGFLGMVLPFPVQIPHGLPASHFGVTEMNSGFGMLLVLIGVCRIGQLLKDIVEMVASPYRPMRLRRAYL